MTSGEHNKYLSWGFLAYGVIHMLFLLMISVFLLFFVAVLPTQKPPNFPPKLFLGIIFGFTMLVQLVIAMPLFIASYGLWKRKSWAKIAGLVGGVIASLNFPLGTALCVYTYWFLLGDAGKEIYGRPKDEMLPGNFNRINMNEYIPPPQPPNLWEIEPERKPDTEVD
jgi:hypothetical protein